MTTTTLSTTPASGLPPKPPSSSTTTTTTTASSENNGVPKPATTTTNPGLPPSPRKKPIVRRRSTSNVPPDKNNKNSAKPAAANSTTPPLIPKPDRTEQRRASTQSAMMDDRRSALQRDVERYQENLTPSECRFLQELVLNGTDPEVEMAHCKLLDENLFGLKTAAEDAAAHRNSLQADELAMIEKVSKEWLGNESNHSHNSSNLPSGVGNGSMGSDSLDWSLRSSNVPYTGSQGGNLLPSGDGIPVLKSVGSAADNSVGSERRQEMLQQRRQENQIFDRIWQAHENGLAVTRQRSRRSIRSNSLRFSSSTAAGRFSAIFRRGPEAVNQSLLSNSSNNSRSHTRQHQRAKSQSWVKPQQGTLMNDNRSDNMRRRPSAPASPNRRAMSIGGRKPSLRRLTSDTDNQSASKPALRRLMSDSSRKSVSFVEVTSPHHGDEPSQAQLPDPTDPVTPPIPRQQRTQQRSASQSSLSSIPSIHLAHSIRSNAVASPVSATSNHSIPPIPHVNAMRSCSIGSGTSLYAEGRDPSNDEASSREEKKVMDLFPRIPTKLEVQQTENSSQFVKIPPPKRNGGASLTRYDSCSSEYFQSSDDIFSSPEAAAASSSQQAIVIDPSKRLVDPNKATIANKVAAANAQVVVPGSLNNSFRRPVLMRDVSIGEGVEVADLAEQVLMATPAHMSPTGRNASGRFGLSEDSGDDELALQMANSFDETMSFRRMNEIFRRPIKRTISDEAAAGLFVGGGGLNLMRDSFYANSTHREQELNDTDSWQMDDEDDFDYYDPWMVIEDEYENGYGGGGTLPFQIIGTSTDDVNARPHVLSPPLMESLQQFLPFSLTGENFWLKYSMVRDGASMHTFLKHARNAKSSILAIETTDGEVFGAFTSECWRKNWNFFGTEESFLWRMRHSRLEKSRSIIDQAHRESEIDVYPFTGENNNVQYCINGRLAVGGSNVAAQSKEEHGGVGDDDENKQDIPAVLSMNSAYKDHEWGYGLSIQNDLLEGTSSPCLTFGSPPLSRVHADGSLFEIMNLELWALTPCYTVEEAEKLELGKLFLEKYNRD